MQIAHPVLAISRSALSFTLPPRLAGAFGSFRRRRMRVARRHILSLFSPYPVARNIEDRELAVGRISHVVYVRERSEPAAACVLAGHFFFFS